MPIVTKVIQLKDIQGNLLLPHAYSASKDNNGNDIPNTYATIATVNTKQDIITGAISLITNDNLESQRVVVTNGIGKIIESGITTSELNNLSGTTSNIQTQFTNTNTRMDTTNTNLNTLAENTLNKTNITNCITKIPQDIKLELNNGVLTLKAGSKLYYPNGFEQDEITPHFDEVVLTNDIVFSSTTVDERTCLLFVKRDLSFGWVDRPNTYYGSDSSTKSTVMCYRTDLNRIIYENNTSTMDYCLPICVFKYASTVTSLDQVFNGFGYMDTMHFVLPGVEALAPNGFNSDGTLNNIKVITSRVFTNSNPSADYTKYLFFTDVGLLYCGVNYTVCTVAPNNTSYIRWYNPEENIFKHHASGETEWVIMPEVYVGDIHYDSNGQVDKLYTRTSYNLKDSTEKYTNGANYFFYRWTGLTSVSSTQSYSVNFTCRRGNPIHISINGDINPTSSTAWAGFGIYKNGTRIAYHIAESHAASHNIPFYRLVLDTDVVAGQRYTYMFRVYDGGNGTINFDEEGVGNQCPFITIFEL